MLSGLLGCFGQLFTATVAPGWPLQTEDSLLGASTELLFGSNSGSNGGDGGGGPAPQAIVTLRNNEVTRVKANVEAASFESAVSPRIAVRLLHMLLLAVVHKFGSGSSKRLELIHKVMFLLSGRVCFVLDWNVCVVQHSTSSAECDNLIMSCCAVLHHTMQMCRCFRMWRSISDGTAWTCCCVWTWRPQQWRRLLRGQQQQQPAPCSSRLQPCSCCSQELHLLLPRRRLLLPGALAAALAARVVVVVGVVLAVTSSMTSTC